MKKINETFVLLFFVHTEWKIKLRVQKNKIHIN